MAAMLVLPSLVFALSWNRRKFGIAIAARIPMMATTIMSSMSVKPLLRLRIVFTWDLPVWCSGRRRVPPEPPSQGSLRLGADLRRRILEHPDAALDSNRRAKGRSACAYIGKADVQPEPARRSFGARLARARRRRASRTGDALRPAVTTSVAPAQVTAERFRCAVPRPGPLPRAGGALAASRHRRVSALLGAHRADLPAGLDATARPLLRHHDRGDRQRARGLLRRSRARQLAGGAPPLPRGPSAPRVCRVGGRDRGLRPALPSAATASRRALHLVRRAGYAARAHGAALRLRRAAAPAADARDGRHPAGGRARPRDARRAARPLERMALRREHARRGARRLPLR